MNNESISHQSFGEKKLTGRETWRILTEEVKEKWPQYTDIVLATAAMNDVILLQAAVQGNYPNNDNIKQMQKNIRQHHHLLKSLDMKRWIYATMIMRWYGFGKVYYKLYGIKHIGQ